ncbi:DUF3226 domain-containing protein [Megasphaera elsdenii]|jgi:hypothetical protein|uniref:DUF3226 domain-containing protein n=1 Tax=Megasphaera elsdenii TaxID=907 RepID=UPI0005137117|nr:DUF3226 domain-containing protein [Megasphaera elsdenii]KGI89654.1 hypothetical protein JY94_04255 [Megasphaera elsdenii]
MNSIILCEGETDQIVLSEYFCHMYGFEFLRGAKNKPFGNAECCYIRGEDQLAIVYAAGNDFSEYVQKVLKINRLNTGNTYTHMAIVSDHDSDEEIQQRWQGIAEVISEACNCVFHIQENQWLNLEQPSAFGESLPLECLFLSIPLTGEGALETFLLNAIEHEPGNSFLAQESKRFVAELIKKKGSLSDDEWNPAFLKSRRMQVKAPLGVFFGVAWPDRAFNDAREMFKRIPWQKYRQIQTSFQVFDIFRQK